MIYVCSDIHGNYEKYIRIFETINFTDNDTIFILGDIVDRGNASIKILQDMMYRNNVIPILGNHEYMAKVVMEKCVNKIIEDNINIVDKNLTSSIADWFINGGLTTFNEFKELSNSDKYAILNYIEEFLVYEEISVKGQDYILIHAGISNFDESKNMNEYYLDELLFERTDYSKTYFKDKILITGHTPVSQIQENHNKNTIFKTNNHIAIDGGCGFGGKLIVYCLNNDETIYI